MPNKPNEYTEEDFGYMPKHLRKQARDAVNGVSLSAAHVRVNKGTRFKISRPSADVVAATTKMIYGDAKK